MFRFCTLNINALISQEVEKLTLLNIDVYMQAMQQKRRGNKHIETRVYVVTRESKHPINIGRN